jgi:ABC-type transport system involved in Fe-S cluster assembly fused permease/ATPase subunit
MLGIGLIAVLYFRLSDVGSKMVILPFLAIYILFTILETVYAYRIAQKKIREKSENVSN